MNFYKTVTRDHPEISPVLMQKLNFAAMEIMATTERARVGQPASPSATQQLVGTQPDILPLDTHIAEQSISGQRVSYEMAIAYRILRTCILKAISLLQTQNLHLTDLFLDPKLQLPLQIMSQHALLYMATARISSGFNLILSDAMYTNASGIHLPPLFRVVEGDAGSAVPRLSPPNLQTLQFGRTRTIVQTDLAGFSGEWLEAIDVEEYLAQRGVFIRNMMSSAPSVITLSATATLPHNEGILYDGVYSGGPWHGPPQVENGHQYESASDGISFPAHNVFGQPLNGPLNGPRDILSEAQYGFRAFNPSPLYDNYGAASQNTNPPIPSQARTNITIDVDKLIEGLANNAICLGPGPGIKRERVDEALRDAVVNISNR